MSSEELERLTCQELIHKLLYLFETNQEEDVDEALDWFLFTYSPEHAYSLVQKNAEAIKDPTLLDIAMTKIREIYEPEIFLETINVIACIEGHEQEIAKSGVVNSVVIMMGRDIDNSRSQALGCKVLANLSNDPQVREWIGKVKGITKIINATKRHRNAVEVIIECFRALANLSFNCKSNKESIIQEHGIEAILDTMDLHKSNVKLVNSGLKALRNIVRNIGIVMELQQHTLTREVMMSMSDHRAISDLQVNSIWILIGLMSGNAELKRYIPEQGAVDHILLAMETHKADANVQLAGGTAIALFAKSAVNRGTIARRRGIQILLASLQTHRDFVPVSRAGIKALFRLAFNKSIREKIGKEGIIEIVETMKSHPDNAPLQRMAIICLLQLAKSPTLRDTIQQDAVSYIIQARNRFSDIPHVQSIAFQAVESLVIHSPLGVDAESLTNQIKQLKLDLENKDRYIDKLNVTIKHFEAYLKKQEHDEDQPSDQDKNNKIKQHQKEVFLEEIKKTEGQTKKVSAELETIKIKLKEEEKKLVEVQKKRKVAMEELTVIGKKKLDVRVKTNKNENTKIGPRQTPNENEKKLLKNKSKQEKMPTSIQISENQIKKTSELPLRRVDSPIAKKSKDEKKKSEGKRKRRDTKTPTPRGGVTDGEDEILPPPMKMKLVSDPTLPDDLVNGSDEEPIVEKPIRSPVERVNSRTLARVAQQYRSVNGTNNEDVLQLRKEIESVSKMIEAKEKELETSKEDRKKFEAQVVKLGIDLKGAHILIQTLQKESLNQIQNRMKETEPVDPATGAVFTRHQKKVKNLKEQVTMLEQENDELKKEIKEKKRRDSKKEKKEKD